MKSILLIVGHWNIENIGTKGLRKWRSAVELRKSTGAAGERDWLWMTLMPKLKDKLIAEGIQVFITDAIYHEEIYSRDYDLALALHYDAGGTASRCIISPPRTTIDPTFISPDASKKADEFIQDWLNTYPTLTGIPAKQSAITDGMTDYYAWDYIGTETPAALIEHGNNTCPTDHDKMFNQADLIAQADVNAIVKYFGLTPEVTPTPPTPDPINNLDLEKKINELSGKVVSTDNKVNTLTDSVGNVVRKIDDMQKDITEIYKDRDTLAQIQSKLTENTNSINNVSVANTNSTTELKSEIRSLGEAEDIKLSGLDKRITALEQGQSVSNGKFASIKKLWGKLYLVTMK